MSNIRVLLTLSILLAIGMVILSFTARNDGEGIPFPEGYLQWSYVKKGVLLKGQPGFDHYGGIHHIYANAAAVEGYKTGVFPKGAYLVFDVFEAIQKDSSYTEGRRRIIDVMVKDSVKYASTGGWGFEEFQGDSKTDRNLKGNVTECYNCHSYRKAHDYVFSVLPPSPSRP